MASAERSAIAAAPLVALLQQKLRAAERTAGLGDCAHPLALGIPAIDVALGGGLAGGALHEIAAAREAEIAAATGFALALAARTAARVLWIAEDLSLAESGAPYGPGLEQAGLAPERLITVAAARARDVLWAMEEALRCRAVGLVIGELRARDIDAVATRRLALAAAAGNSLGLILRPAPDDAPCPAATRWIVGAALSLPLAAHDSAHGIGPPRLLARLVRNRRGHLGSWIVEWDSVEQRFVLAANLEPVARPAVDRPHRPAVA